MANTIRGSQYHVPSGGPVIVTDITSPVQYAELTATFTTRISWSDSKTGTAKVEVSRDGGVTWSVIASGITNVGFYDWLVTSPGSTAAYIRVTTVNGTDSVGPLSIIVPDDLKLGELFGWCMRLEELCQTEFFPIAAAPRAEIEAFVTKMLEKQRGHTLEISANAKRNCDMSIYANRSMFGGNA